MILIIPDTTMGAFPERLGSFGTANVPHTIATIRGLIIVSSNRNVPEKILQAHIPKATRAIISSINLIKRLGDIDFESLLITRLI